MSNEMAQKILKELKEAEEQEAKEFLAYLEKHTGWVGLRPEDASTLLEVARYFLKEKGELVEI